MNFTGINLLRKRNFYAQNDNFGVNVKFSVDSITGIYNFGVSGSSTFDLKLESGKLKFNDLFLHNYVIDREYFLELQFSSGKFNLLKDFIPLVYGASNQTGIYDYIYFKRDNASDNANFYFEVDGLNLPNYQVDEVGYWINTGQNAVTGNFSNNGDYDIRVFSSDSVGSQNLDFIGLTGYIPSSQSNYFQYGGNLSSFDFSQPILTVFNTNFGEVNVNFKLVDATTMDRLILFSPIPDYNFDTGNQINRTLTYSNYSGGFLADNFKTPLVFKLEYVSGSGNFTVSDFASSAQFTANATGNILKSGFVDGSISIPTGNSDVTGVYTIEFQRFQWATGPATGYFSGFGTGLASGINYTGLAYGGFTGSLTGLILNGSGEFVFNNSLATGVSFGPLQSINYTGYTNATGYVNLSGLKHDDFFYIGVESTPLVRGLQFNNETGLVYYLSGAPEHKVNSYYDGSLVRLVSLFSGEQGNGTFIRNGGCNLGSLVSSSSLTGGVNIGTTGDAVCSIGQIFSGYVSTIATGSGNYTQSVTANEPGIFSFERTFTGAWDLLTGLSQDSLTKVPEFTTYLSGNANLAPNSSVIFQVNHQDSTFNTEGVRLIISGENVINPIVKLISQ